MWVGRWAEEGQAGPHLLPVQLSVGPPVST